MSEYAAKLKAIHAALRSRAAPYGFKVRGSIATGAVIFCRDGREWRFTCFLDAERFMDGYETARAWDRPYVGTPV